MKNRRKGFTMVELIIVIALIGIFSGLASIGMSYIQSGNIKATAKTIDSTLETLKYTSRSRENKPYMYIYKLDNRYYLYCSSKVCNNNDVGEGKTLNRSNGELLGNQNVSIELVYNSGSKLNIGNGEVFKIAFKKGVGGFIKTYDTNALPESIYVKKISGSGMSYKIHLVPETGKHYIEKISE